jgi:hypothetical protein
MFLPKFPPGGICDPAPAANALADASVPGTLNSAVQTDRESKKPLSSRGAFHRMDLAFEFVVLRLLRLLLLIGGHRGAGVSRELLEIILEQADFDPATGDAF